jgi:hypothetical protein
LIHNNRRFARFLETNFVSEYGEKTSLLELTTNPKYGWDTKDMDQRKMLAQRADAWASICMPIMTADGKPPKETV